MIIFLLFLALLLVIITVIFAVQNAAPIPVIFLSWEVEVSLALLVVGALVLGVLVMLIASLPGAIKRSRQLRNARKKLSEIEKTLEIGQKEREAEAKKKEEEEAKAAQAKAAQAAQAAKAAAQAKPAPPATPPAAPPAAPQTATQKEDEPEA